MNKSNVLNEEGKVMKYRQVKSVLLISTLVMSFIVVGCGKTNSEQPVDSLANTIVDETTQVAEATVEDVLKSGGIEVEVIDPNLDKTMAGTYYIITEDQNLYKSHDITSEVIDTLVVDSEVRVSGKYGDTELFEVVDEDANILGYVDSSFCDTVKGGYVPEDSGLEPNINDGEEHGTSITDEQATLPQEQLDEILNSLIGEGGFIGDFTDGGVPQGDGTGKSLGDSQVGTGDYSNATPHVVD